jgi:predicted DNA-binding WGR domain protein
MRIYLQTPPLASEPLRFCHLMLQQDLISGWTLVRESGRQGYAGRVRRFHFPTREAAEEALVSERERQLKHGFRIVFAEGSGDH